MIRKMLVFLLLLCLWFIGGIFFPYNPGFYSTLSIPGLVPSVSIIKSIWTIILILNTISSYYLIKDYDLNDDYYFIIILNYLFCEFYPLFFFFFNSLILSMICNIVIAVSTLFLVNETKNINKTLTYLFVPYLIWSFVSLIFSISIYIIN